MRGFVVRTGDLVAQVLRGRGFDSLDEEGRNRRIVGHELLGRIVDMEPRVGPKYAFKVGDVVSTESHIVCGTCYQCRVGDSHVCERDKIIGISQDGCFAEYVKLPAKALWRTDLRKIRPEVAAVQEPFGNAVHVSGSKDAWQNGRHSGLLEHRAVCYFDCKGHGSQSHHWRRGGPDAGGQARQLGCDDVGARKNGQGLGQRSQVGG